MAICTRFLRPKLSICITPLSLRISQPPLRQLNRSYHSAKATLSYPESGAGIRTKQVEISIGDPGEAYVYFDPLVGSILVGRPLPEGSRRKYKLTFFHKDRTLARGPGADVPRLTIEQDLGGDPNATESAATLFHGGLLSSIALNGTPDGKHM